MVRTRREPWPWKRHLICCLMNVCVRRVDEAVATSIQELYQKELSGAARRPVRRRVLEASFRVSGWGHGEV